MYFEFQQRISTGETALDVDIRGLAVVHLGTASFLLSATGGTGGLVSYQLGANGTVQIIADREYFSQNTGAGIGGGIDTIADNSSANVILGGKAGTAMIRYNLSSNGSLSGATATLGTTVVSDKNTVTATVINNQTIYYSVGNSSGQLVQYTATTNTPQSVVLNGLTALDTVTIGALPFLLATQYTTQGISSYRINTQNGALVLADSLGAEQGLGISTPTTFDTISAFDKTWVVLGSAGTSTLSVFALDSSGGLSVADHVMDTSHTRFGGVQAVAIQQIGDRVLIVAGGADDGLSLFTLMPDGRLIHLETISHTTGAGLMNVGQIETTIMDNALKIFVSSNTDAGISLFSVDLSALGITLRGDRDAANQLNGGTGDDLLVAGEGDTLSGGSGDDILVSARGGSLTGGVGADIFVFSETGGTSHVLDFTPGVDKLDLSSYFMMRTPEQLSITSTPSGARIEKNGTVIQVYSSNGLPLYQGDLFGSVFDWPDRIPVFVSTPISEPDPIDPIEAQIIHGGPASEAFTGSEAADTIYGGLGDDTLTGLDGQDSLSGDGGNDVLHGGAQDDRLFGGEGDDLLYGGNGDDFLLGTDGADTLFGDDGNDFLSGGNDSDVFYGGDGDDQMWGNFGKDRMWGGTGNDRMGGSEGNDLMYGGLGNDTVWGGSQHDTLYGDEGIDNVGGFWGNDLAYGGEGNDSVWGNFGNDTLHGDNGDDMIGGAEGSDLLFGGYGNDTLIGGDDTDQLFGGDGDDLLTGGAGDDLIFGGLGSDTFFFYHYHKGNDRITDFNPEVDIIRFDTNFTTFDQLRLAQQGNDVLIRLNRGDITLVDTDLTALMPDSFLFG